MRRFSEIFNNWWAKQSSQARVAFRIIFLVLFIFFIGSSLSLKFASLFADDLTLTHQIITITSFVCLTAFVWLLMNMYEKKYLPNNTTQFQKVEVVKGLFNALRVIFGFFLALFGFAFFPFLLYFGFWTTTLGKLGELLFMTIAFFDFALIGFGIWIALSSFKRL